MPGRQIWENLDFELVLALQVPLRSVYSCRIVLASEIQGSWREVKPTFMGLFHEIISNSQIHSLPLVSGFNKCVLI